MPKLGQQPEKALITGLDAFLDGPVTLEREWANRLAAAVADQFSAKTTSVQLLSVRAVSPQAVELIFSDDAGGRQLKGIRLDSSAAGTWPERLRASTIEELAFDLIHLGICEPRAIGDFLPADNDGVAWLPTDRWLAEVG